MENPLDIRDIFPSRLRCNCLQLSIPRGPFKTSSYRFHPPIFRHQRFSTSATRLNSFRTANTAPCPGFQNDPTSSYLRAPSRFSRGVLEGKESREGIQGRGGDPQSVQASLNGPCLIRHRRLILKNPEQDKPFPGQGCRATPDLEGSYEPLRTEQIEQPLFFSLADNWIPGICLAYEQAG